MDYYFLKGRIVEKFETLGKFANEIGLTPASFTKRLNGKTQFTIKEVETISKKLRLNDAEIIRSFFDANGVHLN
jgi:hypothetical protein